MQVQDAEFDVFRTQYLLLFLYMCPHSILVQVFDACRTNVCPTLTVYS